MMAKVQDMVSSEVCFSHQSKHVKTDQSDEQHGASPCVAHNMAATKDQYKKKLIFQGHQVGRYTDHSDRLQQVRPYGLADGPQMITEDPEIS